MSNPMSRSYWSWGLAYVAVMTLLVVSMSNYRASALAQFGTVAAREDWEAWRRDVAVQGQEGPVHRRIPASEEPPVLILMRDFFWTCLTISGVLTTCLFVTLMFAARGAFRPQRPPTIE